MPHKPGPPPTADPGELAPDSCPNCGGELKFSENRPEGLCPSCGIFVEVLRSSPSKPRAPVRPLPSKMKIRTATTKELLGLCHKFGLSGDGEKEDLVDRLLFYVDEQDWQAKVAAKDSETPAPPPTEDVASRKQWATFFLNYESELGTEPLESEGDKPPPEEPAPAGVPESEPRSIEPVERNRTEPLREAPPETPVPPEPLPESSEPATEAPPAERVEEPEVPPPPEDRVHEIVPPPPEAEAVPEPVPEPEPEFPGTGEGSVRDEPEAEPVAAESVVEFVPASGARASATTEAQTLPAPSRAPPVTRSRWRRAVYYVGVVYVTIGGAGLILGSVLHDLFRVPLFGAAFTEFGRLNVDAVIFGLVFLGVGLAEIAVGLRRIRTRPISAAGA